MEGDSDELCGGEGGYDGAGFVSGGDGGGDEGGGEGGGCLRGGWGALSEFYGDGGGGGCGGEDCGEDDGVSAWSGGGGFDTAMASIANNTWHSAGRLCYPARSWRAELNGKHATYSSN